MGCIGLGPDGLVRYLGVYLLPGSQETATASGSAILRPTKQEHRTFGVTLIQGKTAKNV